MEFYNSVVHLPVWHIQPHLSFVVWQGIFAAACQQGVLLRMILMLIITCSHTCRRLVKIFTFQNYYLKTCSPLYSTEYWIKLHYYCLYYLLIFKMQNSAHKYFLFILDQIMNKMTRIVFNDERRA